MQADRLSYSDLLMLSAKDTETVQINAQKIPDRGEHAVSRNHQRLDDTQIMNGAHAARGRASTVAEANGWLLIEKPRQLIQSVVQSAQPVFPNQPHRPVSNLSGNLRLCIGMALRFERRIQCFGSHVP